ncbi:uncharacterized protein BX664DRAFT_338581 [Halteromyces radiatus]|uniref:uncharacterized protein n=1 Tax=Halteromyces radiatus TaxID=101107 RepID=UPI00221FF664|nr:uncharacterized protein BX664DRAFT_338581 [Halteromyces radiatus]KAI8085124.1 hypothetical protein BX664DRAFT_338581 [Halteromyces radiatus]
MEIEAQFDGFINGAPELQLINATDMLRSGEHDEALTFKALQFLRYKAMQDDREAKMKLSIIYSDGLGKYIEQDQREAAIWARSVYDKQLSSGLAACSCYLMDGDYLSDSSLNCFSTLALILGAVRTTTTTTTTSTTPLVYLAGLLWIKGIGIEQDVQRGLACLEEAATHGNHKEAAYELGRIYSDRYIHSLKDMQKSLHWYARALELGDERALCDLAYGYYEGEQDGQSLNKKDGSAMDDKMDIIKNDTLAFRYASQGAKKDRYCQYILGHLYLKGRGTTANAQEAVIWLEKSAQQGFTEAIEELAMVYLRGVGNVGKDYTKAYSICMLGAENNVVFCQAALGDIYRQGWGVDRDYHKAFQYYQTAASHDDPYPYSQHMLGEMFLNGEGVPQDLAVAKEWFTMAEKQGYEPSRHKLQTLTKSIQSIQDSQNGSFRSNSIDSYPSSPIVASPTEKKSNRWSLGFFTNRKK